MPFETVVLFFVLGVIAAVTRSDLRLPPALYDALSIFLLLTIGLKGGVELARHAEASVIWQAIAVVVMGACIPLMLFPVLRYAGKMTREDAASVAAHYGSVSVVTFAVGSTYLAKAEVPVEGQLTVFLVLLEAPAILIGVALARGGQASGNWGKLAHEVVFGKSVFLLLGGLAIGWIAGPEGIKPLDRLFFDLFKGVLAFFLLEMGLVAGARLPDLRRSGAFLVVFAVIAPMGLSLIGAVVGWAVGLSVGGTALLATLAASASYIAAPAAMRVAVPEANPALSIGASLGVTFPFNIVVGIPLYHRLAEWLH